jgi:hypothetical protein
VVHFDIKTHYIWEGSMTIRSEIYRGHPFPRFLGHKRSDIKEVDITELRV